MASYVVRYGQMRLLGVFSANGSEEYRRGMKVVARTNRGLEVGDVLEPADAEIVARLNDPVEGQILREMTPEDRNELERIQIQAQDEMGVCRQYVEKLGLEMQLVDIEHIFGGERVVVYYLAENRVDFRELVKKLAGEFQTRIEMRQIGVRDEAKLLADYGDCGTPVCCNNHLVQMPPVSMKMAKLQKATLDPTKISGRCGRLKCCLRYEYDTYEELLKELPSIGANVSTPEGPARVIGHEILMRQVLVQTDDRRRVLVDVDEVTVVPRQKPARGETDAKPNDEKEPETGGKPRSGRKSASEKGSKGRRRSESGEGPRRSSRSQSKDRPNRPKS